MMKKVIEFLICKVKKRDFKFSKQVNSVDVLNLTIDSFFNLLRGLLRLRKVVFLGRNVEIKSANLLSTGHSVIVGSYSKLDCLGDNGIQLGDNSTIGHYCIIKVSGTLSDLGKGILIGDNVGIGDFCHIGGAGGVVIGDDTIIGAYFSVHPENHNFDDLNSPIRKQGVNRQGITVGSNCWIGAKVTLLDGCVVGDGCVVAAGSVVKGVFPNNSIIGGIPAKVLKLRGKTH